MTEQVKVAIIMGSQSDWPIMSAASEILDELQVPHHVEIVSAHRTPDHMAHFSAQAKESGFEVIIAGAGGAAHLPGMVAAQTLVPVVGVPIPATALQGMDAMMSIVQMPGGVPVATMAIGKPGAINAGLYAAQLLGVHDKDVFARLAARREASRQKVMGQGDPRALEA